MRPPVIDGIEEHDPTGRIEELDFLTLQLSALPFFRSLLDLDRVTRLATAIAVQHLRVTSLTPAV